MAKILITGAAGFIGSHLVDFYLHQGHEVVGVDCMKVGNYNTGFNDNLLHAMTYDGFTFYPDDVATAGPFHRAFHFKPDIILHFASPAVPRIVEDHPLETLNCGSRALQNLIQFCTVDTRIVFASSSEIYGEPLEHPQSEDYFGNVDPTGPRSCYDEAKRFGEATMMAYHRKLGSDTGIVRLFNCYGPRCRDDRVVPMFIRCALAGEPLPVHGDGTQTRSFCYIDDTVAGIDAYMKSDQHLPMNIGNPEEIRMIDLAHAINTMVGNEAGIDYWPRPPGDPSKRCPDITRAGSVGWKPSVGLKEGLERTIAWWREQ